MVLGLHVRDLDRRVPGLRRHAPWPPSTWASVKADGYGFQIEMAYAVAGNGGRIVEVPIAFGSRERGTSKMSSYIVVEALAMVTWWALRDRVLQARPAQAHHPVAPPDPRPRRLRSGRRNPCRSRDDRRIRPIGVRSGRIGHLSRFAARTMGDTGPVNATELSLVPSWRLGPCCSASASRPAARSTRWPPARRTGRPADLLAHRGRRRAA